MRAVDNSSLILFLLFEQEVYVSVGVTLSQAFN